MAIVHRLLSPVVRVRAEESTTLLLMFLYSFLAMTAYNILKPLATGTFIAVLGADNVPIMLLVAGPLIAVVMQGYTALIARLPQRWVIQITQGGIVALLIGFSIIFRMGNGGISASAVYLFRLILGVLLISQFWTLANDVYKPREAKRFFGFIGGGAALGGLTASFLVQQTVDRIGFNNLLLVSAVLIGGCMVIVTLVLSRAKDVGLEDIASAGKEKGVGGSEAMRMLRESKHLQVIAIVIGLASMGASLIETQLNLAAEEFAGAGETEGISALLATVQLYTSFIGFIIQVWLTSVIHRYLGIGVALLLLPISLGGTAVAMLLSGTLWSSMLARTLDTSLRYSVDKTTREILFMPLPSELKYQAKPFVDVTIDRISKSVVNVLILVLIKDWGLGLRWPQLSFASLTMLALWVYMSVLAKRGYLAAFRNSIEQRHVQPAEVRLDVADLSTVETLVEELAHPNEERVLYAIDVLESLDKRNLVTPLLLRHESGAVRARALAALGTARAEIATRWAPIIQGMIKDENPDVRAAAIGALASIQDQDVSALALNLLDDSDPHIVATAAVALSHSGNPADAETANQALATLATTAAESDPSIRRDLASAIRHVGGADCRHLLIPLLHDHDPTVAAEAMRSVRALPATDHLFAPTLISLLGHRQLKSGARETLVGYGESVVSTLGHFLSDTDEDLWVRRHIPATLARVPCQASMDLLVSGLSAPDGFLRFKVLTAIGRLSREHPELTFKTDLIEGRALKEGLRYFNWLSLYHNLFVRSGLPRDSVLALTLDQKLARIVDRIYRLLSLLYPWKDISAAKWATEHGDARARSSAFEYLDNILASQLRSRLMPVLEDMPLDEKVRRGNVILKTRPRDVEESILRLVNDEDQVVAAAAIDFVQEKELSGLTDDVEFVLAHRDPRDWYVFEAASWTLASQKFTSARRRELWLQPLPAAALVGRLRHLPMFSSVGIDELFRIAGAGHQVRHEAASILLHEGTIPDNLHVLLDGRVVATTRQEAPREITPPETLGFRELLNGNLMDRTIKTREPCVSLRLSTDEMRTLLADNTDLVQGLFRTLAGRGPRGGTRSVMRGEAGKDILRLADGVLTPIQKVLALQPISIFSLVSATEMRHLVAIAHQVELEQDAVLSSEADPPVVCVVLSGALTLEAPNGSMPAVRAEPGDVVGMNEALAGRHAEAPGEPPRRLTVAESGSALRIDRDDLLDLLGQRPNLLQQIFNGVFGRNGKPQSVRTADADL
ncbi:MAG: Npt1/Npt2 family nucleotide transporter [Acidobacteriota bacterium]|nr:Npt1/Npt2 family nucleotide transporter [Acidobacteriota bacterium]